MVKFDDRTPGHHASSLDLANTCCTAKQVADEEKSAQLKLATSNVMKRGEGMRAGPDMRKELPMTCLPAEQHGFLLIEDENALMLERAGNNCPVDGNLSGKAHREHEMVEAWEAREPGMEPNGNAPIMQLDREPMAVEQDRAVEEGTVHPMTLEWLRDLTVEDARQYLMGVTGTPAFILPWY